MARESEHGQIEAGVGDRGADELDFSGIVGEGEVELKAQRVLTSMEPQIWVGGRLSPSSSLGHFV